MVRVKFCKAAVLASLFLSSIANAEVLFEGYARVFNKKKAIGYAISKYEFDAKTKKFHSTTFMKVDLDGTPVTESLKAVADEKFRPISYSYATIVGNESKTIDAKFAGTKMTAQVKTGAKSSSIKNTLKPDTILSTFLVYYWLTGPQGIQVKKALEYSAIAEEEGQVVDKARAIALEEVTYAGQKVFKIKNEFKGHFTSFVNSRGEILGTAQDDMAISTELMADAAKATEGFAVNKAVLKALFGEVPEGKNNLLAKSASIKTEPAGKQQGIPQGTGIQLKNETPTESPATTPQGK